VIDGAPGTASFTATRSFTGGDRGGLSIAFRWGLRGAASASSGACLPASSTSPLPDASPDNRLRHLSASVGLALAAAICLWCRPALLRATAGPMRRAAASRRGGWSRIRQAGSAHAAGD
jgi:hypothetical protein